MLIRQTLLYLPAQLLGPLLQFAVVVALTHYLSPADYGLTMLVFTTQELLFMVSLWWWASYMLRYGGTFAVPEQAERFRRTQAFVLLVSILVQLVLSLVLEWITVGRTSFAFLAATALFMASRSFLGFLSERARMLVRIGDFTLLQIVPPLGGLALSIVALDRVGTGPGGVLLAFGLVQALLGLVMGLRLDVFARPGRPDRAILMAAAGFGLVMILAGGLNWAAFNGIRFVVQEMGGAAALGLLSVGWGMAQRLAAMAGSLVAAAAYPLAVKALQAGDEAGATRQISDNSALLLAVMAPAVAGVMAINAPMMTLLVASEFEGMAIAILPMAMLAAGLRNMRVHGWDQLYLLFEKQQVMMRMIGVEVLLLAVGSVLGYRAGGVQGAVQANALVVGLVLAWDYLYLRARHGLHAPLWHYARILLAAGVMWGAFQLAERGGLPVPATPLGLLVAVLAGGAVYTLALALLFPRERALVTGWLSRASARR